MLQHPGSISDGIPAHIIVLTYYLIFTEPVTSKYSSVALCCLSRYGSLRIDSKVS